MCILITTQQLLITQLDDATHTMPANVKDRKASSADSTETYTKQDVSIGKWFKFTKVF